MRLYTFDMEIVIVLGGICIGYLAGSFSPAIVVTRFVTGSDIRQLGNANAGTANVGRSLGTGFGAIVFFADVAKAILPMLAVRTLFDLDPAIEHAAVVLTGTAAVLGHCKPLYFRFRGGSGIATTFGAIGFVVPFELFASMLLGFVLVRSVVRNPEYRLGRWTAGVILLLVPFVVTISTFVLRIQLSEHIRIGGHPWYIVIGVWFSVLFAIYMNRKLYVSYIRNVLRTHRPS